MVCSKQHDGRQLVIVKSMMTKVGKTKRGFVGGLNCMFCLFDLCNAGRQPFECLISPPSAFG